MGCRARPRLSLAVNVLSRLVRCGTRMLSWFLERLREWLLELLEDSNTVLECTYILMDLHVYAATVVLFWFGHIVTTYSAEFNALGLFFFLVGGIVYIVYV